MERGVQDIPLPVAIQYSRLQKLGCENRSKQSQFDYVDTKKPEQHFFFHFALIQSFF